MATTLTPAEIKSIMDDVRALTLNNAATLAIQHPSMAKTEVSLPDERYQCPSCEMNLRIRGFKNDIGTWEVTIKCSHFSGSDSTARKCYFVELRQILS